MPKPSLPVLSAMSCSTHSPKLLMEAGVRIVASPAFECVQKIKKLTPFENHSRNHLLGVRPEILTRVIGIPPGRTELYSRHTVQEHTRHFLVQVSDRIHDRPESRETLRYRITRTMIRVAESPRSVRGDGSSSG